ncbi:hypothetical protein KFK09_006858 [Dendrobium nobile]|uniref:Uncharacterized protein n=1 Tax=Dendrobium nobile TaxID=94219 RepID=A0A8T3BUS0_DENNO|nr:hypothetical protein KFK09_006858 [Dendrobium nobile]
MVSLQLCSSLALTLALHIFPKLFFLIILNVTPLVSLGHIHVSYHLPQTTQASPLISPPPPLLVFPSLASDDTTLI